MRPPTVAVTDPVDDPPPVLGVAVARLVNTFPGLAEEASRTTAVKVAEVPAANELVMVQLMRPAASVAGVVQFQPLGVLTSRRKVVAAGGGSLMVVPTEFAG